MVLHEGRTTFADIAGHTALNLVNTVAWRLSQERFVEEMRDYRYLVAWALQFGLIDEATADQLKLLAKTEPQEADAEVARVRGLREEIYRVTFGGADDEVIAREYVEAIAVGELRPHDGKRAWTFPLDLALPRRLIAHEALDLVTRFDDSLFAQCGDAECGWVFLDTSPRHNRRWCVSADCGNRNRVREYYERNRGVRAEAPSTLTS